LADRSIGSADLDDLNHPGVAENGIEAAGTSENVVRFGISVCAAGPAVALARKRAMDRRSACIGLAAASCNASKVFSQ
jgi:phosphoheptose isomerase